MKAVIILGALGLTASLIGGSDLTLANEGGERTRAAEARNGDRESGAREGDRAREIERDRSRSEERRPREDQTRPQRKVHEYEQNGARIRIEVERRGNPEEALEKAQQHLLEMSEKMEREGLGRFADIFREQAQQMERQRDEIKRHHNREHREGRPRPSHREDRPRAGHPDAPSDIRELRKTINELREEISSLSDAIHELRKALKDDEQ